jgi:Tol biopolymer transport system component
MAQPFDAERLASKGEAVPVAEQIQRQGVQPPYGLYSASSNGVLVYQTGTNTGSSGGAQLTWVDRKGASLGVVGDPGNYNSVSLSPDATRAVVGEFVPLADLWTVDLARGVKTRLTFGSSLVLFPVWSPDGRQIAFSSPRNGLASLYLKAANGTGGEDPLMPPGQARLTADWSRDGRYILFADATGTNPISKLMAVPLQGERKPFVVMDTPFTKFPAAFSPDGRWIAYSSNESGRSEVYVAPFTAPDRPAASPVAGGKERVSPGGGDFARWRRDGRELYYISAPPETLMAAEVSAHDSAITISAVTPLFRIVSPAAAVQGWIYDVTPDGQRFLLIKPINIEAPPAPQPPTIVLNWLPQTSRPR